MTKQNDYFNEAFTLTMKFEVGPHFNTKDPDTLLGKIDDKTQKRKVGYVNHPKDPGGETKFGIAQNSNEDVCIKTLTMEQAKNIYYTKYWKSYRCHEIPYPMNIFYFDACVNHGKRRGGKLLQMSVGAVPDGAVGPATIRAANATDVRDACQKQIGCREYFYRDLVARRPNRFKVFLNGWLNRIKGLQEYMDKLDFS